MNDHKVIVITGANSGIGEALALHYAKNDITLGLIARNKERLDAVAKKCEEKGAKVKCGYIDVTDEAAMSDFLLAMAKETPIDMVIANAGVSANAVGLQKDIVKATKKLFSINVDGLFNTILPLIPSMKERQKGQIVLMASIAAFFPVTLTAPYSATKAAVRMYAHGLRGVLYRDNIRVNVVCPGYVQTPLTSNVNASFKSQFIIQMPECVKAIVEGLENDDPEIAFPPSLATIATVAGGFLVSAREFASRKGLFPPTKFFPKRKGKKSE